MQLEDRKLFLPPAALRPMRRILSLPQAADRDFLRLDAGFLRRTFYELGRLAGLPPAACAPRALRYARALELLELRMPPEGVAAFLGLSDPLRLERLFARRPALRGINRFAAVIESMQAGYRAARLVLRARGYLRLVAVAPFEELADIEPAPGKTIMAEIPQGLIFPSETPLPLENRLRCEVLAATGDGVETRLRLKGAGGLELHALLDAQAPCAADLARGARIDVYVPVHAVKLLAAP